MAVTIYDIAERAGKSYATVSRALKGSSRISTETRERIMQIASDMDYRPDRAARSLRSQKTHTIGLVIPDVHNPFYTEFLRLVEGDCLERDYQLMAVEYALNDDRQRACLERMLELRCDGVIAFLDNSAMVRDLLDEYWAKRIPCITAVAGGGPRCDRVGIDLSSGVRAAVDHLAGLGHKHIAMACSVAGLTTSTIQDILKAVFGTREVAADVLGGFARGLLRNGLELGEENFILHFSNQQREDGIQTAQDLVERRDRITAVIAQNDLFALGILQGLRQHGLSVPEDVSVVGCDNSWLAAGAMVPLTTIDIKIKEVARACVEMVFARLGDSEWVESKETIISDVELVVRQSTGPARNGSVA